MRIMQERPLLHEAEFFTEGVVRFSAARTRRAYVFAATNRGATQRIVFTGAKLDVGKPYSYVRRLLWELEVPKENAIGIWNPYKNTLETQVDCVFFSKLFPQQSQFSTSSLLSSRLLSVGKGSEAPAAPGKAHIVLGNLSVFLEEGGSAAGEESPSPGLPHHHPHRPVFSVSLGLQSRCRDLWEQQKIHRAHSVGEVHACPALDCSPWTTELWCSRALAPEWASLVSSSKGVSMESCISR